MAEWSEGVSRAKYSSLRERLGKLGVQIPSMRRKLSRLQRITGIKPQFIHCCYQNCVAFTGEYSGRNECPLCNEKRYIGNTGRPRKQFAYIPILDRLKLQYRNASRAQVLSTYRQSFTGEERSTEIRDFFDGDLYHDFHIGKLKLFRDSRDIAFHMTLDGVQLTNMRHYEVTPVILLNLNLPPEERYKVENILASMVIPGPKKPRNLDSFLRPLVEELKRLDDGAPAFDANTGQTFTLRAWVTMVTGDGPAIADAIGFKRPGNAYRPCRHCMIKGELGNPGPNGTGTYYVPHTSYNFRRPPLRGDNLRDIISAIWRSSNSADYGRKLGITRESILLELRSLHFSRSFPIDIMHCILLNITELLFQLWTRTKLDFEKNAPPTPGHLSKESLEAISQSLANARAEIPTYLSRAPRRIDKHYKGYKAVEWEAWLRYYGTPLLDQHLDNRYVGNFSKLSQIYSLATQCSIRRLELPDLETLIIDFVQQYERLYYRCQSKRLPVCTVQIHYLAHLAAHIRDCGPARYWWQFPMERYCGIIKPKARSKSQMSVSLANEVLNAENIYHIRFTQGMEIQTRHSSFPMLLGLRTTALTNYSQRLLFDHLGTEDANFKLYSRCQMNDELIIGSKHSQRRGDINRQSNRICYRLPGHTRQRFAFATVDVFAAVDYPQERYLAWVRGYDDVKIDRVKRVASFAREGNYHWIEVAWVESLCGVLRDGGVNLLVTDVNLFD